MKTAPELLALLDEAQTYVALRASCGLAPDPQHDRMRNLMLALAALPPADKAAEQRVRDAIRGRTAQRTQLRVIAGTDCRDAYEQTDATGWVADPQPETAA